MKLHRPNSQQGRLQRHLLNHPNVWLRMTDLMRDAHCNVVHSKVDKLREGGMRIENRLEHFHANGEQIVTSYYMFIPSVGALATHTQPADQQPIQPATTGGLR